MRFLFQDADGRRWYCEIGFLLGEPGIYAVTRVKKERAHLPRWDVPDDGFERAIYERVTDADGFAWYRERR